MKNLLKKFGITSTADFKSLLIQIIKFGIVGVANTFVSLGVYYIFIFINASWYSAGNFFGFVVSVANAFYWNNKFVFKRSVASSKKWESIFKPLLKSYLAYGTTFLLSQVLLYWQIETLHISIVIAPLINLLITIPLNFLINKFWTFK